MRKLLMGIIFMGVLFTSYAQTDSVAVQEKTTPAYFKHGLGAVGGYSLGTGLSYRHFFNDRFGVQGVFGYGSGNNGANNQWHHETSLGLAFLYALHRGHRMTYYAYQSNNYFVEKASFHHKRFITGAGVMAEVRIQDRVALGLFSDVLYNFEMDKVDFSVVGMSFLYNF